jgi:hypothetical protein
VQTPVERVLGLVSEVISSALADKVVTRDSFVVKLAAAINDAKRSAGAMWTPHALWAQLDAGCRNQAVAWTREMLEGGDFAVEQPVEPAPPWSQAEAQLERTRESLRRAVGAIREVRAGLKTGDEVRDNQLGRIAALEHETLVMVDRWLTERVHDSTAGGADLATRVSMLLGMFEVGLRDTVAEFAEARGVLQAVQHEFADMGMIATGGLVSSVAAQLGMWRARRPRRPVGGVSSLVDTPAQRWQQALNRVRLDAGLPMVPVGDRPEGSELDQVRALLEELRIPSEDSSATPEQLAQALFEVSRGVSVKRGSEPIPLLDTKPWSTENEGRKDWWREVARATLDRVGVNVPTSLLPVKAEQLARAIHAAIGASGVTPSGWVPEMTPWDEAPAEANEWRVRVAEVALSQLPQIAQADAESEASFVAQMDAVTSELRQKLADLHRRNADLILASSGNYDAKMTYRGMVMFAADQLGIPADRVDDPKLFGEAFREAIDCRAGQLDALGSALIAMRGMSGLALKGRFIAQDAVDAIGFLRTRLEQAEAELERRGMNLPISPEQLGKAWFSAELSPSLPAFDELPVDMRDAYAFHARRAIEYLSSHPLAGEPGVFFMHDEAGNLVQGRAFKLDEDAVRAMRKTGMADASGLSTSFHHSLEELDEAAIREAYGDREVVTQVGADAVAELLAGSAESLTPSVLEQLREQGEALRAAGRREERSRGHHKLIADALRNTPDASPSRLAEEARDLWSRVDEFVAWEAEIARCLGVSGYTDRQALSGVARKLNDFERAHRHDVDCQGRLAAEREMTEQLRRVLQAPGGLPWEGLLESCRAAVAQLNGAVVPGSAFEVKRIRDALATVIEAAGIDMEADFERPDVTVQKAGDAAAVLRSWPDVLRAVSMFDGDEVEQPDEVAPTLERFAREFVRFDVPNLVATESRAMAAATDREMARLVRAAEKPGFDPVRDVGPPVGSTMDDMLAPVVKAEQARQLSSGIHVTPRVPQSWCYGPTSIDPDPGKRWHIGCGGEVLTFDGVDICQSCDHQFESDVDLSVVLESAQDEAGS